MNRKNLLLILFFLLDVTAFSQTIRIDSLRQIWRNEVDTIFKFYTANCIDTLRGLTAEEWREGVNDIYERVNNCNTKREYQYALRYFGALINDGHVEFPRNGIYNYEGIFQKTDTIFPVWVKSWHDGRVFTVRDFSEQIPVHSEIISINGIPAKDIALKQREIIPCEDRYVAAWTSSVLGGDPLYWTSFPNYLFCEKIHHPFVVEYSPTSDTVVYKITLSGLQRNEISRIYEKNEGKEIKEGFALIFSLGKNTVLYNKINDSIGTLKITMFLGSGVFRFLLAGGDTGFSKKLSKFMKQIQNDGIKHLIIDIRDNPGGYLYDVYELLAYFTNEKFTSPSVYKITERSRNISAKMLKNEYKIFYNKKHPEVLRSMEIFNSMPNGSIFRSDTILQMQYTTLKPIKYKYTGKVYLLTNGMSYSASILFTDLFKSRKLGLLAGESPGGYSNVSSGNVVEIQLPYSKFMSLTVPVGIETRGKNEYIEPDIPIEPTFEEWLHGKHDSLQKLIAMILANKI
ncbi:MAG: hypothetical protein LBR10_14425 [Prevotellaceae bacterium]|jgi:hypothetical protein|nr:hypothetical protein [Prevotellaceae bacterium]